MVVNIDEIKEDGLERSESVSVATLDEALQYGGQDTGYRAEGPANFRARLSKVSGRVLLRGQCDPALVTACKRCVTEVHLTVPVSFTLNMVPREQLEAPVSEADDDEQAERAGSFELNDVDHEPFDGKTIDLDPILREQILLALPISVLCKEDCKGLCPMCGQDLNEKECGCERRVLDPRLAVLKDIKLN